VPASPLAGARRPLEPLEQQRLLYGSTPGDDPALWRRPNNRCLCATCGEVFSGEPTFNAHPHPIGTKMTTSVHTACRRTSADRSFTRAALGGPEVGGPAKAAVPRLRCLLHPSIWSI
jgi:hypothetical protein